MKTTRWGSGFGEGSWWGGKRRLSEEEEDEEDGGARRRRGKFDGTTGRFTSGGGPGKLNFCEGFSSRGIQEGGGQSRDVDGKLAGWRG